MSTKPLPAKTLYITIAVLAVALAIAITWALSVTFNAMNTTGAGLNNNHTMSAAEHLEEQGITLLDADSATNNPDTEEDLKYLLEEEKLAYDVYRAMYDKWSIRVFDNISRSESMHQNTVLALLESRDIEDSRSHEPGVFNDASLQKLYDSLIERGNKSKTDALQVGVIIEETDIEDLSEVLARTDEKDSDIKDVIENLIHSSENHLRAFNRQLG